MLKKISIALLIGWCYHTPLSAQVTLDGTLGKSGVLPGPNYQIGADLGQQHGGNLFHSFRDFNLQSHESATFSGPTTVQNIISRITGGNPSNIDGLIHSTIPNADMYFLNPFGIMFGPNAKLDVQGSFHASTADTLQLQDGGEFNARIPTKGLLTVAPPSAFGFLTDSPAALSLQDSQLTVPYGQTFSLTGGHLSLTGAQVNAPGGQVTLSSLAQAGQLALANPTQSGKGGTIELQNQTKVSTNGIGGGKVLIRGGQLVMDHSAIEAFTLGNQDGKGIDIATNESVTVKGDMVAIGTPTLGTGKGGNLQIATPRLEVTGSFIDTSTVGSGPSGDLDIHVNQVSLQAGGHLSSLTFSGGNAGSIRVDANDSVIVAGHRVGEFNLYSTLTKDFSNPIGLTKDFSSQITSTSFGSGRTGNVEITTHHLMLDGGFITVETPGINNAQNITIEADSVTLKDGGLITSDTYGEHAGGNITLKVAGDLTIIGRKSTVTILPPPFNLVIEAMQSAITSSTLGKGPAGRITISANRLVMQEGAIGTVSAAGTGPAGQIQITVNQLQLDQGGSIASNSGFLFGKTFFSGTGDGGEVQVEVAGDLRIHGQNFLGVPSNISSNTLTTGRGGNVTVHANHLQVSDGGLITANSLGAGLSGGLRIQADTLEIFDQGQITTSAQYAGGGDIHLTVANLLYLRQGQLTTSVMGGTGNGGNITIDQPQFVVMNHGQIIAQADAGHGGNIHIVAQQFLKTPDSLVSASSRVGLDGQVVIESPDQTISNSLLGSPKAFMDVSGLLPRLCENMSFEEFLNRSTFYVYPLAGSSLSPYDLKPSHALRSFPKLPTVGQATVSKERRGRESQRLAWLMGCHS